jgi:hypothetical protein
LLLNQSHSARRALIYAVPGRLACSAKRNGPLCSVTERFLRLNGGHQDILGPPCAKTWFVAPPDAHNPCLPVSNKVFQLRLGLNLVGDQKYITVQPHPKPKSVVKSESQIGMGVGFGRRIESC